MLRVSYFLVRRVVLPGAVVLTGLLLRASSTHDGSAVVTEPVVIAWTDLRPGVSIDRGDLVIAQWPTSTIPAGAFRSIDAVAGRFTRVSVFRGEALVPGRLAPEGTGPGVEVKITPGKRAMSFRMNDISGIAGLIQPNARVDILVIVDGAKGRVAKLFMENMRVLAIGAVPQRSYDGRAVRTTVCTVEVTPEEGERLAIASTQGSLQIMLRGYGPPDAGVSEFSYAGPSMIMVRKRVERAPQPFVRK
jgi:pilus assembly protein CpaB